ncbi:MAG: bifunctional phosphopantothenoylcysteine decarboxylase/phosphopantothenate--cysteine ligase CoaBC [Candidatus Aminicenantes bacterium]|nr:bifunctional phosphopantothenoylcysteine decarboxylase/phosphopantothenate--cysteine ligase CoaBC [Candidatus Aminicenantes bacterium]
MSKIVIGVSSSISIYKSCEVIRLFQEKGYEVQVVMTENASRFISPVLFKALTGKPALVDLFKEGISEHIQHVHLADEAVLFVVAPATANVIAKMASGISDDFLTTFYTAAASPVLIAPAMNERMYLCRSNQANMERLKAAGVRFVEAEQGYLACGKQGYGRLASVREIVSQGELLIQKTQSLKGRTILVTGGPTREYLDSVRFLTNRSSGKMGFELAEEAKRRGAKVVLISGPTHMIPHPEVQFIPVETADQMGEQVMKHFEQSDAVIMAAAVCDYKFSKKAAGKIKKKNLPLEIQLSRTEDILEKIGTMKKDKICVGFAAEVEDIEKNAKNKLTRKNLDLIVANDISGKETGFESEFNDVFIIHRSGKILPTGKKSKLEISKDIMDEVEVLIERKN